MLPSLLWEQKQSLGYDGMMGIAYGWAISFHFKLKKKGQGHDSFMYF